MTAKQTAPAYLTSSQVGRIFHVSPKTVGRWAAEGKLPHLFTLGGHRRYPEASIRAILEAQTERPAE